MTRLHPQRPRARRLSTALTAAAACLCLQVLPAASARAAPVTWTLHDVTFVDGGTASGWFVFDANALNVDQTFATGHQVFGVYGDFHITTTFGGIYDGWDYDSADPVNIGWWINLGAAHAVSFAPNDFNEPQYLNLRLSGALTDAGGTLDLVAPGSRSYECADFQDLGTCRNVSTGTISALPSVTAEVAEPGVLALAGAALVALGLQRRRRSGTADDVDAVNTL